MSFIFLSAVWTAVRSSSAQGDDIFIPGITQCNGNTSELAECMSKQADRADQWLRKILESYKRRLTPVDPPPYDDYDPVDKLTRSQRLFEEYRETMADFAYDRSYPGSIRDLNYPATKYYLTVDRIRWLLIECRFLDLGDPLPERVDLERTDWCEAR